MNVLKEFRDFAVKGNAVDMAVGVVIGAAFSSIVKSMVSDLIMPVLGLLVGGVDFSEFFIVLKGEAGHSTLAAAKEAGAVTLSYGLFLNTVLSFLIVSFSIFMVVKNINRLRGPKPSPAVTTKSCPECCSQIALKAKRCPNCTSILV